jgi:hypothetical protein
VKEAFPIPLHRDRRVALGDPAFDEILQAYRDRRGSL